MPELSLVPPDCATAPQEPPTPPDESDRPSYQEPYPDCSGRDKRRVQRRIRAMSRRTLGF